MLKDIKDIGSAAIPRDVKPVHFSMRGRTRDGMSAPRHAISPAHVWTNATDACIRALLDKITAASLDELREMFGGTAAEQPFAPGNERFGASVKAVLLERLQSLIAN